MTRDEARTLLDANTLPVSAEPADEALRKAQEMMRTDEALTAWIEKRRVFDERVAEALVDSPVPHGLRERILQAASKPQKKGIFQTSAWLAVAAAVVITGAWLLMQHGPAKTTWQKQALVFLDKIEDDPSYLLDDSSHDMSGVKAALKMARAPMPDALPKNLASGMTVGCKVVTVDGHRASIICFEIQPGIEAHLVMVDAAEAAKLLAKGTPRFATNGTWQTANWTDGTHAFMLATRGSEEMLRRLFV